MIKRNEFIGIITTVPEAIKEEFKYKNTRFVIIEIRKDKKYGARAELHYNDSLFDRMQSTISKKSRQAFSKNLKKALESDKPVDTSKWVKPDEESIRNELIMNLFKLLIYKKEWWDYNVARGKADVIYSILHSNSPRNPQSLMNYSFEDLEAVLTEMKSPIADYRMQISFPNYKKKRVPKKEWFRGSREIETARNMYKKWIATCIKNMIVIKKTNPKRGSQKSKNVKGKSLRGIPTR